MGGRHLKPFLSVYGHVTVDQIISIDRFLPPGITAARLGCPAAPCAYVGPDFPGKYLEFIEGSGVIMDDFVVLEGEETSTCVIVNDRDLNTRVFFYQGPQGHADSLDVRLTSMARSSDFVHFCTGQASHYFSLMEEFRRRRSIVYGTPT